MWNRRRGTFLEDLAAAGVTPEQVDYVVITHMHVDHVGWNTRLVNGAWVPTFPNARYVFPGEEWQFWKHENERGADEYGCIDDSVLPIVASGQAMLVDDTHRLDRWLAFEPSIGHTPGHVSVRLTTGAREAVFSGDLMHRVVQVAEPQWSSRFCYDGKQAAQTRPRVRRAPRRHRHADPRRALPAPGRDRARARRPALPSDRLGGGLERPPRPLATGDQRTIRP